jgi:hypothetical protein
MKKEFATRKQSLALKELGFDEKCFCYFDNEKELRTCIGLNNWNNHEGFPLFVSCPLKQQVFRWFREKYDLSGIIDLHVSAPKHWYVRIDVIEINDFIYHSEDEHKYFITYEEAENACIDKLIEIAKQQDNEK